MADSMSPEARMVREIRAILAAFDWEYHDRQLALEAIERIVNGGGQEPEPAEPGPPRRVRQVQPGTGPGGWELPTDPGPVSPSPWGHPEPPPADDPDEPTNREIEPDPADWHDGPGPEVIR